MIEQVREWFNHFERALNGWPDYLLSLALVITGICTILVGLFGPRWLKLLVAAWVWFP